MKKINRSLMSQMLLWRVDRRLWALVFCVALSACERDIDIDMDIEPPVVVNALFNPDSIWRVRVNKAWAMGEALFGPVGNGLVVYGHLSKNIEDASVQITSHSGEQIHLVYDTNGYYLSPFKPHPGDTYTLSVNVPGERPISSSVVLPEPVRPDTAYFKILSANNYLLTLEFTDPPGPTAYELTVSPTFSSDTLATVVSLETADQDVHVEYYWTPSYNFPDGGATLGPVFWALDDRNFQGQKKKLIFSLSYYGKLAEEWVIRLRTLSDEYARYRATSVKQQESFNDPFAQPIQVFNNIDNGVGVFAGYSVMDYHFKGI